jgi:hypothetical protein
MKKTITKKAITLLSLVLLVTNLSAQVDKVDKDREERNLQNQNNVVMRKQRCDTAMKHTNYIFEGKLISSKSIGGAYISNIIEVQEVISGSIQKGTIEIISNKSRWTDDKGNQVIATDNWQSIYNGTALYFCTDVEKDVNSSGITNANSKTLRVWEATAFSGDKIENHGPYSMFNYFSTVSQVYEYLQTNYNVKINKRIIEKKSQVSTTVQKKTNISPEEQKQRYEKHKAIMATRFANTHPAVQHGATCTDLYLSEYLCGHGNNKSIEVYNPTNAAINLSAYSLLIYHGASYTPTTIALTGTISAQATHVISKPNASAAILAHTNQTSNNLNFNGDEIIVLNKATIHIDKIGVIGTAIGAGGWTLTPTGSTVNTDIRRNYNIGQGDTAWSVSKGEWTALSEDSVSNLGHHANFCSSIPDPDVIFSLANPQTTGTSPKYFEFDIYVSGSDNSTYLEDMQLRFNYNTAAFGTKISFNNKLTLTNLGSFADTLNYGNNFQTDHSPFNSVASIGLSANYMYSSYYLTNITPTPQPLMHAKIEIANCNVPANITIYYPDSIRTACDYATSSYQTISQFPTLYTHVDSLGGSSHLNNLTCSASPMQITDFNAPINAGIGSTLTIIGTGFGATRGNGQVKFKNADNGGATYLNGLNANDYITSWTNTQIQINLHSFVDSLFVSNPDSQFVIGGGNFIVINNAGQTATSNLNVAGKSFSIYFSLSENRNTFTLNKNRINLRSTDPSGGYVLRLNPTDFPSGSPQRIAFTKAVHDWRCITEANLNIGADTNIVGYNTNNASGTNYVFFATAAGFVAETFRHPNNCTTDKASLTEADMQFSTNYAFDYDTNATHNINPGQYDFYEVALHELGHFIGLEHNVVTTELMYFQELIAPISTQRIRLTSVGTSPVDGGTYSVNHSITALSTGAICWPAMVLGGCAAPAGINQYLANNFFFNLYPNPSNGSTINIDFQAPTNTEAQVVVYDMMGRAVYSNNLGKRNDINSTYSLDVSNLSQGMYMVNLIIDKVKVCQKFIKQ